MSVYNTGIMTKSAYLMSSVGCNIVPSMMKSSSFGRKGARRGPRRGRIKGEQREPQKGLRMMSMK